MSLGGKSKDIICTSSDREVSSALNIQYPGERDMQRCYMALLGRGERRH